MRKGQAEMVEWIPRLLMMLVAVLAIAMLVRYYAQRDIDEAPITRAAYLYRLYYDDILMYADPVTKRVYPGVVDMDKFTDDALARRFTHETISSCMTAWGSCQERKTICHNKDLYESKLALAQAGLDGPGSATTESVLFPVTLRTGGESCAGTLNITIVRPNTWRSS